jgi:hypothetical protein
MGKLAILKSVPLEVKSSFADVDNEVLSKYLKDKVEYTEINNTMDMYRIVQNTFGKGCGVEVSNCFYNDKYVIQSINIDDDAEKIHSNVILIKQNVYDDFSYTFLKFNPEDPSSDEHKYCDITEDDVINVIRRRTVINGVYISEDADIDENGNIINGGIMNEDIITLKNEFDVGKISTKNLNKEWAYLNISNITNANQKASENEINQMIAEKMNAYCADHFFMQISLGFCVLNCYYNTFGNKPNRLLSKLFKQEIFDDAIIFMQSNMNNDTDTRLPLDTDTFSKIVKLMTTKKKIAPRNKHFFNLYYEL